MEFPKDIEKESVLGIVKFIGTKEEFLKKAGEVITDLKTRKTRSQAEKAIFGDFDVSILVYGTVKGEVVNEIWFVKPKTKVSIVEINMDGQVNKTETII